MATIVSNWLREQVETELESLAQWLATAENEPHEEKYSQEGKNLKVYNLSCSQWLQIISWPNYHKPQCILADSMTSILATFNPVAIAKLDFDKSEGTFLHITSFDLIASLDTNQDNERLVWMQVKSCAVGSTWDDTPKEFCPIQNQSKIRRLLRTLRHTRIETDPNPEPGTDPDADPDADPDRDPEVVETEAEAWIQSQHLSAVPEPGHIPDPRLVLEQGVNVQSPVHLGSSIKTRSDHSHAHPYVMYAHGKPPVDYQRVQLLGLLNKPHSVNSALLNIDPLRMFHTPSPAQAQVNTPEAQVGGPSPQQLNDGEALGFGEESLPAAQSHLGITISEFPAQPVSAETLTKADLTDTQASSVLLTQFLPTHHESSQLSEILSQGPANAFSCTPTEPDGGCIKHSQTNIPSSGSEQPTQAVKVTTVTPLSDDTSRPIASLVLHSSTRHRMPHPKYLEYARRRLPDTQKVVLERNDSWMQDSDNGQSYKLGACMPTPLKAQPQDEEQAATRDDSIASTESDIDLPCQPLSNSKSDGIRTPVRESSIPLSWSTSPPRMSPQHRGAYLPRDSSAGIADENDNSGDEDEVLHSAHSSVNTEDVDKEDGDMGEAVLQQSVSDIKTQLTYQNDSELIVPNALDAKEELEVHDRKNDGIISPQAEPDKYGVEEPLDTLPNDNDKATSKNLYQSHNERASSKPAAEERMHLHVLATSPISQTPIENSQSTSPIIKLQALPAVTTSNPRSTPNATSVIYEVVSIQPSNAIDVLPPQVEVVETPQHISSARPLSISHNFQSHHSQNFLASHLKETPVTKKRRKSKRWDWSSGSASSTDDPHIIAKRRRREYFQAARTEDNTHESLVPHASDENSKHKLLRFSSRKDVPEPQRAKLWLLENYVPDASSRITQSAIFKAYKATFASNKENQPLKGMPFLALIPPLFEGASIVRTSDDLQTGAYYVRGIRIRNTPRTTKEKDRVSNIIMGSKSDITKHTHISRAGNDKSHLAFATADDLLSLVGKQSVRQDRAVEKQVDKNKSSLDAPTMRETHPAKKRKLNTTSTDSQRGPLNSTRRHIDQLPAVQPMDKSRWADFVHGYGQLGRMTRGNAWAAPPSSADKISRRNGDKKPVQVLGWKLGH